MAVVGRSCFRLLFTLSVLCLATSAFAGPPVVEADPLTPQEQQKKFKLKPGFEIQLVAAEPDIQKPMNLAFDAQGRLWVTHSIEYPFAATNPDKTRDGLTILDGIGPDGKATKVTKFADKLNIPIGVLPLPSGREAIIWSIPNIWKVTDTDGDGKADKREILYGPFDFVDTHGNQNAFRLGLDGWVYACHGFRNNSKVKLKGEGPVVLEMQSGNTYRFKTDGSAIEQISWGQVNPFGMCIDSRGDMFTADCHSKPITMILRGGYYDSFGKADDGLGYAPITTSNDHGSTGIAGVVAYASQHFPPEFTGSMFVGNVVTNIIHRDTVEWRGSSPWVDKVEDFVTCDDWWFHPVDLQLGPDGALYVSDFYNSIIGHYEVDLKHPRRDRHRGRIWRIVYTGKDKKSAAPVPPNLHTLPLEQLVERLADSNTTVRNLASFELQERFKDQVPTQAKAILERPVAAEGAIEVDQAHARVQALWLLLRAGQLDEAAMHRLAADPAAIVRNHLMRAIGELPDWNETVTERVRCRLNDVDPFVKRSAADAVGRHTNPRNLQKLANLWIRLPATDAQLVQAVRIAIRNTLKPASAVEQIATVKLKPEELERVVEIALAVPSEAAAWFTFDYIRQHEVSQPVVERCLRHVARYVGPERLDEVAAYIQKKFPQDISRQSMLFQSLFAGLTQRGTKLTPDSELGKWAANLATGLLDPQRTHAKPWENLPVPGLAASSPSPWGVTHRATTDGNGDALFFDSIANGEHLTGMLTSAPFTIPDTLTFWMCGHNGLPGKEYPAVNHVRLRLLDSGEVVMKDIPPRSDVARKYTWDLKKWAGQKGVFEAVDADTASAYAWLAVGRFEPSVLADPVDGFAFVDSTLITAVQIAQQLRMTKLAGTVVDLIKSDRVDTPVRAAAGQAGISLNRDAAMTSLAAIVQDAGEPVSLRIAAAQLLGPINVEPTRKALTTALATAPGVLQQPIALALASTNEGGTLLIEVIAQGKASARLLQDKPLLDRLNGLKIPNKDERIKLLTQGLSQPEDRIRDLTAKLTASFTNSPAAAEAGLAVFKKTCAACHRINNDGGKVGPQLDGIGIRGLERILEDVLDPNRNVDAAFRATVIAKTDGMVVSGLRLREEGGAVILGDAQGKEVRIPQGDIEESRVSNLSPMPSNVAEQLNENDLRALLAFLLSQKQKPPETK